MPCAALLFCSRLRRRAVAAWRSGSGLMPRLYCGQKSSVQGWVVLLVVENV